MNTKKFKVLTTLLTSVIYVYLISNMINIIIIYHKLYLNNDCTYNDFVNFCVVIGIAMLIFFSSFFYSIYIMWLKKSKK